ncbi:uncharacterized protein EI90DRAFT_3115653 [Cantharellus anzutake]|uniref:uncharacterized protein n=1 Tax=Cantharellus anzutake TaxID=1750568 RepID=UPI001904F98F|nr:uncharacterized protein EI90DRAFT_3115653 [Cantharellus anzutake]KAF8343151.1 hypothetical protein EI90DRAFT_3115653 [Cantharellus anzutake]
MSSPLWNASSSTFGMSILTLQADFSSGLTLLTTAPPANEFLRATEGPFAELKELVMQHTSIANRPQFQPLGHSSVQTVGVKNPDCRGKCGPSSAGWYKRL